MATARPAPPREFIYYGVKSSMMLTPPMRELLFFRSAKALLKKDSPGSIGYTGEGRFWHARMAIQLIFGKHYEMHDWAEDCIELFCDYDDAAVTGPKSAGKTTAAAIFALLFWACNPTNTAVIVCSTTVRGLRQRIWKEIKKYFRYIQPFAPDANQVESKMAIQATKNDDGNGIFGVAVAGGQTEKALGRLIGFHPKNLLIIVDEATDTPEAIDEACANLGKVEGQFQIIRLGNAKSRFDPHGKACEPKKGWKSISVEDDFWETVEGGCLHLDGTKSPNIKLNKRKYPYLLDEKEVEKDAKRYGENSPKFWRFIRGFWPPDGGANTVLTETMAVMFDVKLKCGDSHGTQWLGQPTLYASLDPAFGGDRCVLRFGNVATCRDGKKRIEFTEVINVALDSDATIPIDYQIATKVREECKARAVAPQHFGLDSTGTGRGVAAILQREWSKRINVISFSGNASDRPVSQDNPRPCHDEYIDFVTELWFFMRVLVEGDQIRGLSDDDVKEFCLREWEQKRGDRTQVESKPQMKERTGGVSPDLADACVVLLETARRNGFLPAIGAEEAKGDAAQEWADQRRQAMAYDFDGRDDLYTSSDLG